MTTIKMGDSYDDPPEEETTETPEEEVKPEETPEETETPPDSSPEIKSDNEPEEESSDEPVVDPKEIQGLTDQTVRLRDEIKELRKERRELRAQDKLIVVDQVDDLSEIAPTDISVIERVLKAMGYVRQEEIQGLTYKERVDAFKDQWLEKHPEYLPENDPDDKRWTELNREVSAFRPPSNPKDILKILDRSHSFINRSFPKGTVATQRAAQERLAASSRSKGTTGQTSASSETAVDKSAYQGFSDKELEELGLQ